MFRNDGDFNRFHMGYFVLRLLIAGVISFDVSVHIETLVSLLGVFFVDCRLLVRLDCLERHGC